MKLQAYRLQPFPDRTNEPLDVSVTALLRGIELLLDHVVSIVLQVFERQILQLRLERVQTQLMGERRIEVRRLFRHLVLRLLVRRVADETHDAHAVRDHDQDDAHILGKGQQEVTEIVTLYDRVLVIEMLYLEEAVDDMLHRLAILGDDLLVVVDMTGPEERGDDRLAA